MKLVPIERKVTGIAFWGERGSGKTLAMTTLAYIGYLEGADVYANYNLGFPYVPIEDTNFYHDIKKNNHPKIVCIDDALQDAKGSVHDRDLNRVLTLARKLVALDVKCTMMFSMPLLIQYTQIIREYTNYFVRPKIFVEYGVNHPLLLHLEWYLPNLKGMPDMDTRRLKKINLEKLGVCDMYDTKEAPKAITSGRYKEVWNRYKGYAKSSKRGILAVLTEKIADHFGVSHNLARQYARNVIYGNNPYEDEPQEGNLEEWGGLKTDSE